MFNEVLNRATSRIKKHLKVEHLNYMWLCNSNEVAVSITHSLVNSGQLGLAFDEAAEAFHNSVIGLVLLCRCKSLEVSEGVQTLEVGAGCLVRPLVRRSNCLHLGWCENIRID